MSDRERSPRRSSSGERRVSNGTNGKSRGTRKRSSRSRSYSGSPKKHSSSASHRRKHSRRSRSHSHSRRRGSHSRSRSYTPYDNRRDARRSRSRSFSRGKNIVPIEGPPPNRCIGVFGMSLYTDEKALSNQFSQYGKIENIQLVYDKQTNRSRGFGFIYFDNIEDAIRAKERSSGIEIDGHRIRVDYSITKRPHTPTPGIYMGKRNRRDDYGGPRHSPSPYARGGGGGGGRRSRSRSFSR